MPMDEKMKKGKDGEEPKEIDEVNRKKIMDEILADRKPVFDALDD